jgi:Mg/Co/Ni transporter MgtE
MTAMITSKALRSFFEADDIESIRIALRRQHAADIVHALEPFDPEETARILLALPEEKQPALFGYFDHDTQMRMARASSTGATSPGSSRA